MNTILDILFIICIIPFGIVIAILCSIIFIIILLGYPFLILFKKVSIKDLKKQIRQELRKRREKEEEEKEKGEDISAK